MDVIEKRGLVARAGRAGVHLCVVLVAGAILAALPMANVSSENTLDRIQAGQWVVASMYWEDKLVSTGKSFNPIGWHAAHKTLFGAGTLQGLGTVYMEVLSIPPVKHIRRPVVESLFAVNDANANCIGASAC